MKITLVRHGQTESNYLKLLQGRVNNLLNDTGRRQCKKLAEGIKDIHYDYCYMSPLVRCVETAMILIGDRVEMISDKMGDATIDFTAEALGLKSGAIVWVKDCKTYDDVKAKWEAEEPVEALVVTLLANNVVTVTYFDNYTEKDAK